MESVLHNSDLVREILLRLPAESLLKFQSVCKEWLSLISSAEFRQKHAIRCLQLQPQSLIIHTSSLRRQWFHQNPTSRRMTSLSLNLPDDDFDDLDGLIIVQSSNGLLLLQPYYHILRDEFLYVHNPATRKSRKIFPTPFTTHPHTEYVALVFDPSKSPYYELVCFRRSAYLEYPATYRVEVYSSESHTWNRNVTLEPFILPTLTELDDSRCSSPVYWNNAIYLSSCEGPYWKFETGLFYFCFDLAKREMKTLPCPTTGHLDHIDDERGFYSGSQDKTFCWLLQESNGHLYHVELKGEGGCESVAVWELDGDDNWLLRHHHVLPPPSLLEWGWDPPSIFTFLVDTCSLLICRGGWPRVYSLNFGIYEDFLDATGQPIFDTDSWLPFLGAFQFGGTLALV